MSRGEALHQRSYNQNMPRKVPNDNDAIPDALDHAPNWYIREWAKFRGYKQADLQRRAGWTKGRASQIWNGKTEYYRQIVVEAAAALDAAPYELMMPPEHAMAIRELYTSARRIAAEHTIAFIAPPRLAIDNGGKSGDEPD